MPFTLGVFTRIYDWLNDPQRNEKIFGARLNEEFDGVGAVLSTVRIKAASGTVTIYTNYSTGSDSTGTGTLANPFKSVAYAYYYAFNAYDLNGTTAPTKLVIQMADNVTDADGLHGAIHALVGGQGGEAITIQGGTNSVLAFAQVYFGGNVIRFKDLTIQGTGATYCLEVQYGAFVYLAGTVKFGNSPSTAAIHIGPRSGIEAGTVQIAGINAAAAIINRGFFDIINGSLTVTANQTVSVAWVWTTDGGTTRFTGATLTNAFTVTGKRFVVDNGSRLLSGNATATYFPGSTAGVNNGGFYDGGGETRSETVNTTFDLTAASGTQDTTGFGFDPKSVEISACINNGACGGTGFASVSGNQGGSFTTTDSGTTWLRQTTAAIIVSDAAVMNYQQLVVSFISGGIRFTNTKVGTPSGTLGLTVIGHR